AGLPTRPALTIPKPSSWFPLRRRPLIDEVAWGRPAILPSPISTDFIGLDTMRHTAFLTHPVHSAVLVVCVAVGGILLSPASATAADEPLFKDLLGGRNDLLAPSEKQEAEVSARLIAEKVAPGETAALLVTVTLPD